MINIGQGIVVEGSTLLAEGINWFREEISQRNKEADLTGHITP
jgi:hypothetical protein